ncbi:hypothetical protein BFJ66_g17349 [Fusarium oxysporum f. sp. cepae]|nr:hypothetical protein BFJ66_g17349 [Fusarium oxysporum f. sp. cepae]
MTASDLRSEPCSAIYPYVLLSTYRLLICPVYGFASVTDEVATHLKTRHRDIKPEHRQNLIEKIRQVQKILCNEDELRELRYQTDTIEPIPHLAPPKPDGLNVVRAAILFVVFKRHKKIVLTSINGRTQEAEDGGNFSLNALHLTTR